MIIEKPISMFLGFCDLSKMSNILLFKGYKDDHFFTFIYLVTIISKSDSALVSLNLIYVILVFVELMIKIF